MDPDPMIAAELTAIPEPRKGYRGGWWVEGHKYSSKVRAEAARLALATQRVTLARAEAARRDRTHAAYAARGMFAATTRTLRPGDTYSIPATRPPFRYYEYVVASVEHLPSGASLVRHVIQNPKDADEQSCLLHTSDLFLYRRPAEKG